MTAPPTARQYLCSTCGLTFAHTEPLRRHYTSHDPKYIPPICMLCFEPSANYDAYIEHLKEQHRWPSATQCRFCSSWFLSSGSADQHELRDHQDVFREATQCDWCPSWFASAEAAEEHELLNHDEARPQEEASV